MKKEWGDRNAALCEHLAGNGNYDDWVVTTAFYASIHYIDHKMFPIKDNNGEILYNDILHAKAKLRRQEPPHATRKRLVSMYLDTVSSAYNFLYDACMFARYKSYKVKPWRVAKAKRSLDEIKKYCT
jgi:hypothetical protein